MFRILECVSDTYLTDKVISGTPMTSSNVGAAGSLNLFKLYGMSHSGSVPQTELSRVLVQFDLDRLRALTGSVLNTSDPTFWCRLRLRDVYGGEQTPTNFAVNVYPMSASFREGIGKDVVSYRDSDVCNFVSSSLASAWKSPGCSLGGSSSCDYLTSVSGVSLPVVQAFASGEEDLDVDVTGIVSASLTGQIPDSGFRIAFTDALENDAHTYFVKRFGSRHVYDKKYRPTLLCGWDDSVADTTLRARFDTPVESVLYNYGDSGLEYVVSGSHALTGTNCVVLRLTTVQSSSFVQWVSASQYVREGSPITGVYAASFSLSSVDPVLSSQFTSGSLTLAQAWFSADRTKFLASGSQFSVVSQSRSGTFQGTTFPLLTSLTGLSDTVSHDSSVTLRLNAFYDSESFTPVKLPSPARNVIADAAHYSIVNARSGEVIIPYDTVNNASRLSSDDTGMFFVLDACNLPVGELYHVDLRVTVNGKTLERKRASQEFYVT